MDLLNSTGDVEKKAKLRIGHIKLKKKQKLFRVASLVDGRPVWFESETQLTPAPEAFAGLFWIPALHSNRQIVINDKLDPQWRTNVQRTLPVLHRWWGYPETAHVCEKKTGKTVKTYQERPDLRGTGLCFTCGVDSFHSLICGSQSVDTLVYAQGFDVPYEDWPRLKERQRSLKAVAEAKGKRLIVIRTNLRAHPTFACISWQRTHGAALAALGHLLNRSLQHLVIPSSYCYKFARPWGSSWELDSHWSSSRMQIVHDDASPLRREKIKRIAGNRLVQQHLHVCFSRKSETGNCCSCEKCLRTIIVCQAAGHLDSFSSFPLVRPLHQLIEGVPKVNTHLIAVWQDLSNLPLPHKTVAAIEGLLARSHLNDSN